MAQATSERVKTSGHNTGYFYLDWSISQDKVNNKSTITWKAGFGCASGYSFYGNGAYLKQVKINGTLVASEIKASNIYGTEKQMASGTFTINHNETTGESGNVTFYIYGGMYYSESVLYKYYDNSGTWTFPKIDRYPVLTFSDLSSTTSTLDFTISSNLPLSKLEYRIGDSGTWETTDECQVLAATHGSDSTGASIIARKTYTIYAKGTAAASGLTNTTAYTCTITTKNESVPQTSGSTTSITLPDAANPTALTLTCRYNNETADTSQRFYLTKVSNVGPTSSSNVKYIDVSGGSTAVSGGYSTKSLTLSVDAIKTLYGTDFSLTTVNATTKTFPLYLWITHAGRENYIPITVTLTAANCGPVSIKTGNLSLSDTNTNATIMAGQEELSVGLNELSRLRVFPNQSRLSIGANDTDLLNVKANSGSRFASITVFGQTKTASQLGTGYWYIDDSNITKTGEVSVTITDQRGFSVSAPGTASLMPHHNAQINVLDAKRIKTGVQTDENLKLTISGTYCFAGYGGLNNRLNSIILRVKTKKTPWDSRLGGAATTIADNVVYEYDISDLVTVSGDSEQLPAGSYQTRTFSASEQMLVVGSTPVVFKLGVEYDIQLVITDTYEQYFYETPAAQKGLAILSGAFIFSAKKGSGFLLW